ncbi:hypothetical protein [Albibacterium sp.]|uniref:hypothetical protein n=1 Tax=Albibacterium sp. TaxID=2952885 RepID=UPI002C1C5D52|nr:hypothetical protein [Albibacterium sp.]HUH19299.1 hypothetical protein [Albibacterium sp.]
MNILLTGINTYLGKKLSLFFLEKNYELTCLVRNENILKNVTGRSNLSVIQGDLIREKYSREFPKDLDVAFYFSYYVAEQGDIYQDMELLSIQNYIKKARRVNCAHLVYVMPLRSPINEDIIALFEKSYIPYTVIRTSNIVGKDSLLIQIFKKMASNFAIISNSKLASSKCQPIALSDALTYLDFIASNPITFNQTFDIGGPEILSYREMLLQFLQICKIKKTIITLPFVHSFFSSFWLSKSSGLPKMIAHAFSENIQGDLLCENNRIHDLFPHTSLKFKDAVLEAIQ